MPDWQHLKIEPIDYQALSYYSAPKSQADGPKSLDEVDPELLRVYAKLGIPLAEQEILAGVAVDAVFDSVSVATSYKGKLLEKGINATVTKAGYTAVTNGSWCADGETHADQRIKIDSIVHDVELNLQRLMIQEKNLFNVFKKKFLIMMTFIWNSMMQKTGKIL